MQFAGAVLQETHPRRLGRRQLSARRPPPTDGCFWARWRSPETDSVESGWKNELSQTQEVSIG